MNLAVQNHQNVALLSALLVLSIAFAVAGERPFSTTTNFASTQVQPIDAEPKEVSAALTTIREGRARLVPSDTKPAVVTEERSSAPQEPTDNFTSYTIQPRDTLAGIFKKFGAPTVGASKLVEAWRQNGISHKSLRPGDQLRLKIENGEIVELQRKLQNGDEVTVQGDSKSGYVAQIRKVEIVEIERTLSGVITTSFAASAHAHSVPYEIVDSLVDLFGGRVEFNRDLQPGDSFAISYVERRAKDTGAELEPGMLSAATLTSGRETLAAVRHVGKDGEPRYYNERGEPVGDYFLRYPLKFTRISSVFSSSRFHPVLRISRPHNGVDFAAPVGTPVRSIADGVVVDSGYRGQAGNMIKISHGGRYSTAYLHLSGFQSFIRPGAKVSRGQVIGSVGKTGSATGPHLHFSLYDHGRYINPLTARLPTLSPTQEKIPQNILVAVLQTLKRSEQMLASTVAKATKG